MRLFITPSKLMSLKKGCRTISPVSAFPKPRRSTDPIAKPTFCEIDAASRHRDGVERLVTKGWRLIRQHFIGQNTKSPPVGGKAVALICESKGITISHPPTCVVLLTSGAMNSGYQGMHLSCCGDHCGASG